MTGSEDILRWLRDAAGVLEPRRVVRRSPSSILVSKFEEGFAARLHETIDRLPVMFDAAAVAARFEGLVRDDPALTRAEGWRLAITALVREAAEGQGLHPDAVAEVRAGVDSVAALVDAVLWSSPCGPGTHNPGASELEAYRDTCARMDAEPGIFTRYYGSFEGVPVENHCPGSQVARRLFGQAWAICTGVDPA